MDRKSEEWYHHMTVRKILLVLLILLGQLGVGFLLFCLIDWALWSEGIGWTSNIAGAGVSVLGSLALLMILMGVDLGLSKGRKGRE